MIEHIYIPTLGRSQNQITFNGLPKNVQQITSLVVQPKEEHLYANYPIVVLPDNDIGITATRKWIYSNSKFDKYGVFDDDLRFIRRTPNGERSKRTMTEDDWIYLLTYTNNWLGKFPLIGLCQGDLPPTGKQYIDLTNSTAAFFFNKQLMPDVDELDWSLPVCEDIHMVLQLFKQGYKNRVWQEFGCISKMLSEGGCNEWRTLDLINNTHAQLIDLYPGYVSWNGVKENVMGGEYKKIKIKWKKMYTDNQRLQLPL